MPEFKSSKISKHSDLVGEELKQARREQGLDLGQAALAAGVNYKYLNALEQGDFAVLPEGVYGRKMIQDYANYLGLDWEWMIEVFSLETDSEQKKRERCRSAFARKLPKAKYFFTLPRVFKAAALLVVIAVCAGYLSFYIKNVVDPPELVLKNPSQDQITAEPYITVKGETEKEAEITINGKPVLAGPSGTFQEKINLKKGLNIISITAQTKYSRKNEVTKKIILKDRGA